MTTDFSKTPPLASKGVPFDHIHFSGGRTGMTLSGHGGVIHLFHYAWQRKERNTSVKNNLTSRHFAHLLDRYVPIAAFGNLVEHARGRKKETRKR